MKNRALEFDFASSVGKLRIYREENYSDRPTIVFLHESFGCIKLWRDFPQRLGKITRCNILIYDRLGYGRSDPSPGRKRAINYLEKEADLLLEILKECNINDTILFGHSDGGSIALLFGAKYPDRVRSIITEGAHIFIEETTVEGIRKAIELYQNGDLKSKLQKYHADKTDDVFWIWADNWLSDEFKHWNMEKYLPRIACPVLIIQGEEDEYGTIRQVDGIYSQVKGRARKLILPNVKHVPHKEMPAKILEAAKEFLLEV